MISFSPHNDPGIFTIIPTLPYSVGNRLRELKQFDWVKPRLHLCCSPLCYLPGEKWFLEGQLKSLGREQGVRKSMTVLRLFSFSCITICKCEVDCYLFFLQ